MMTQQFKAVIFDWDGTLMDSVGQIVYCLMQAAKELNLPLQEEAAKNIIGLSLPVGMEVLFAEQRNMHAQIIDTYAKYFIATNNDPGLQAQLFAGSRELITALQAKGMVLAIATGKSRKGLNRVLAQTQIGNAFAITRCADETASKPDPLMLVQILDHLGLQPSEAVMVGDTEYDLDMAARLGMPSIGISHGVHKAAQLALHKPIAIVSDIGELQRVLLP